ncbi:MAG: hypothetical protein BGP06_18100 [Rhizobiales bacterium 65-9]|nr:class I SAM-dependent methyltransferase [Hyphomicrobiales bacterium]OJY34750.1 MAG: hypothetical protein BGP06_18100 [Rhizobiales bacterium 65-9]
MTEADPRAVVASGYDAMAERYLRWTSGSPLRLQRATALAGRLSAGARTLDLGCGAGVPVASIFADHGCAVVGVDGSRRQIALAKSNEPRADFICADMTAVDFLPASFDAVTAFYSITHVPRDAHPALLANVFRWLRPGGAFLATFGAEDTPGWRGDWLGAPMFFSHFDAATNRAMVEEAGFAIESDEMVGEEEFGALVRFLWILARKD